jgi:amino ABC transporter, permease protein, 3-TM region, his/glu/gln/arg/opine family
MDFFEVIFGNGRWVYFWHGFEVTMVLTTIAVIAGLILGLLLALLRTSISKPFKLLKKLPKYTKSKFLQKLADFNPLQAFAKLYIGIIRGTPALVQLLIMYYAIFGSVRTVPKLIVAAIAFAINSSAYIAEIIRGGIESVDKGQLEAARSLGFSHFKAMYYVVLPQAMKNAMPGLIGEGVTLFKETSIVGWIGLGDIMRGADDIRSLTATAFQSLFAAAILYLVITTVFSNLMFRLEKKISKEEN